MDAGKHAQMGSFEPVKISHLLDLGSTLRTCRSVESLTVGSMEAPSKAFLLFFLLPDWLKLNHLKSQMECGFSDIFSRHICSTVAEAIGVTNYSASSGSKEMFRKPHLKLLR